MTFDLKLNPIQQHTIDIITENYWSHDRIEYDEEKKTLLYVWAGEYWEADHKISVCLTDTPTVFFNDDDFLDEREWEYAACRKILPLLHNSVSVFTFKDREFYFTETDGTLLTAEQKRRSDNLKIILED